MLESFQEAWIHFEVLNVPHSCLSELISCQWSWKCLSEKFLGFFASFSFKLYQKVLCSCFNIAYKRILSPFGTFHFIHRTFSEFFPFRKNHNHVVHLKKCILKPSNRRNTKPSLYNDIMIDCFLEKEKKERETCLDIIF